ncbi:MAG: TauD/TfdA family dioxygenase [Alphaproteobacteria bacterium]|nr:TauD/TfdA family dioxygenase [Alphaproteobacteria bacterium]
MTQATPARPRDPAAWRAGDFRSPADWTVTLPTPVLDELAAEARRIDAASDDAIAAHAVDPARLPAAAAAMRDLEREVMAGRGFVLVQGLDPDADDGALKAAYWVMSCLLGRPVSQNSYGERLCDVMDLGRKIGEKRVREYQTNAHLRFHTDRCDLVGLLCVRKARSGGRSSIASAVAVFEEIARARPDLVPPLLGGVPYMNVEEGGDSGFARYPVFAVEDGIVSCRYQRNTIETAIRHGAPCTPAERAALDAVDALAESPAFRLDMDLRRGDVQLINNYATLHSRTGFEDFPEPHLKRRMTRVWLETPTRRPVGPHFADYRGVPVTLAR